MSNLPHNHKVVIIDDSGKVMRDVTELYHEFRRRYESEISVILVPMSQVTGFDGKPINFDSI